MAKIEKPLVKTTKKAKATKRKHEPNDDDGVAPKSIILSKESENRPPQKQKSKKIKHKTNEIKKQPQENISRKRKAESSDDEDEELLEPTLEQLKESERPENVKSIVTVRQKKKQKHLERLESQKDQLSSKEITRNEEYLRKWKDSRDGWKFEKLRQISIQQSVFDDAKVSAELWPIAMEYLSGSKGAAKEKITKAAEAVIDELDKEIEKSAVSDPTVITSSEKYRRARELLQCFD